MIIRNSSRTLETWRFPEGILPDLTSALFLGVLLIGLAGCNVHQKPAGPSAAFWENVRPASGETERLQRNARFLKQSGRLHLALEELEEAHRRDTNNIKIVDTLTQCYEELGEWKRVEELYLDALARHEGNVALANNLGFSYYLAGKLDKAEACFRQTLKLYPTDATVRNNLGLVLTRMGRQKEALALWRAAEGDAGARRRLDQAQLALGAKPAPSPSRPDPEHEVATTAAQALGTAALAPPSDAIANDPAATNTAFQPQAKSPASATPPDAPIGNADTAGPASDPARSQSGPIQVEVSAASQGVGDPSLSQRKAQAGLTSLIPASAAQIQTAPVSPAPRLPVLRVEELLYTKVELLNGNGINNFARRNRSRLYLEGFDTVAIGNYKNFAQAETAIIFRPQAARVAQVLGSKYFRTANLTMTPELEEGVEVRVILGRDVLQKKEVLAKLAD
jgi:thioredoxin-like negative regulator of GroEL